MKMNLKTMNHKLSLKKAFMFLNLLIFIFVFILFIISIYMNIQNTQKYHATTILYEKLSTFYEDIDHADSSYKQYLYTSNTNEYNAFKKSIQDAFDCVNDLENAVSEELKWRFVLLENMLSSYEESTHQVSKMVQGSKSDNMEAYNLYLEQYASLQATNGQYYDYVTQQLKSEKAHLESMTKQMTFMNIGIVFIGIILVIVFSFALLNSLMKPLYQMIENVNRVEEGNYELDDIKTNVVEMNTLYLALKHMALRIKENIQFEQERIKLKQRLLQIENDNIRKDELIAQSELNMILNTVNPHFLFNTMNLIYKTASREHAKETMILCENTCDVFRYSLDYAKKTTDLYHELDALKKYLFLENKRYEDRIRFTLEISDRVVNIVIPSQILQPLIDHALIHNLNEVTSGGEVNVYVDYEDGMHTISISDNGKGMPSDLLEKCILSDFNNDEVQYMEVYYVIRRIRMFFGSRGNISFNSYEGCGFDVVINIQGEM